MTVYLVVASLLPNIPADECIVYGIHCIPCVNPASFCNMWLNGSSCGLRLGAKTRFQIPSCEPKLSDLK